MFNKTRKAFTFSELLIASALLAFAFGAVVLSFISCFLLNESNRNLSIATTHAQYVLEEVKNVTSSSSGFNSIVASVEAGTYDWNDTDITGRSLQLLMNEAINTSIADVSGTTLLKQINVTVSWQDRGRDRNMTLETLIAEP